MSGRMVTASHDKDDRRYAASRDKAELRGTVQDSVAEFTRLRREALLPAIRSANPGASEEYIMACLDEKQPLYEEYDPVVQMALMAADHSNSVELRRQAAAETAQYLRPKLKSVEVVLNPETPEERAERTSLAARLAGALESLASAKQSGVMIDVTPSHEPERAEDV